MIFQPKTLDYELSPYTGLTRQSWIEAGQYLLNGIFENIADFDDPVVMPRQDTAVTYPHSADAIWEYKAEYFEGLTRSFFFAAPLIHINPEISAGGYCLRDYYKSHVLCSCTPDDPQSVGTYEQLQALTGDPLRSFQQTVETSALVICLWECKEEIWDTYTKEEKDRIAAFLTGFAHGNTVPQNWRLFNMLDMAFLHMEGYPIDETIMLEHAKSILDYYAGGGWYRDGHSFDYYSCWAFNVYAPIWNLWYGYEHAPYLARKFEEHSNCLMETYDGFFDRDGFTNMWGRSNIYRNAATSSFDGNLLLRHSTADPGLARRIASGSLLQFLTREDFLYKGVPTLGFYGQFLPLVQGYSCAESPFWMGKAFLCLHLPADHPFWTAKENNGAWERLGEKETRVTCLDGPALCFSNHQANGETVLRTGRVLKNRSDEHGMWNYSKLCYNTKYPWESAVSPDVEAQQYVLRDLTRGAGDSKLYEKANVTFWCGKKDSVLYRRQLFNYRLDEETHWMNALNLADFTMPYGVLRVDKLRLYGHPAELTLGAYGFPDNGTEVLQREEQGESAQTKDENAQTKAENAQTKSGSAQMKTEGAQMKNESAQMKAESAQTKNESAQTTRTAKARAVILKGHDFCGRPKQLAMTIYDGWEELGLIHSEHTNPDSAKSIVIYARTARRQLYHFGPYYLISQVITKESLDDFTEDELFPIESIRYTDAERRGSYGPVTVTLKDGTVKVIDFEGIEGKLQL